MMLKTNGEFLDPFNNNESRLQDSIKRLTYSLQSNQALQASAFVGRKVMVCSNIIRLNRVGASPVLIDIPLGISQLTITIYSETHEKIRRIFFKEPNVSIFKFIWDGLNYKNEHMPLGTYGINVQGLYKDRDIILKTRVAANVDSVSLSQKGEGVTLIVEGIGEVALNQVENITPDIIKRN